MPEQVAASTETRLGALMAALPHKHRVIADDPWRRESVQPVELPCADPAICPQTKLEEENDPMRRSKDILSEGFRMDAEAIQKRRVEDQQRFKKYIDYVEGRISRVLPYLKNGHDRIDLTAAIVAGRNLLDEMKEWKP